MVRAPIEDRAASAVRPKGPGPLLNRSSQSTKLLYFLIGSPFAEAWIAFALALGFSEAFADFGASNSTCLLQRLTSLYQEVS